jgi:hypothetical protein
MFFQSYVSQSQTGNLSAPLSHRLSVFDELFTKFSQKKILIGSTDLLKAVNNDSFLNLFKDLWENDDIKRQCEYLKLIVAASSDRHPQIYYLTQNFILKVLKSGLIQKIVTRMPGDISKQQEVQPKILHDLLKVLITAYELVSTEMDDNILLCIDMILHKTKNTNTCYLSSDTKSMIEKLEEFRKSQAEQPSQNSEDRKRLLPSIKPSYGKPTDDFRTLPIIPLAAELAPDYHPFIRKAIVNGQYSSDNDYLDTQFRLMKEDLVEKFRKGILKHEGDDYDIYVHRNVILDPIMLHYPTGEKIHYANICVCIF